MKPYKKHIRFFLVFFLFTLIVAGIRLYWISKALPSKATVLYIDHTRFIRPTQEYPVVSYQTHDGEVITRGTYNLPINTGQTVDILYNPDNPKKFKLNTHYWLWYDIWSWYRVLLVLIGLYYLVLFIVKRNARRTNENGSETVIGRRYSKSDPVSIEPVTINPTAIGKNTKRLPRAVKAVLLLLLPVSLFFTGQFWGVPYARQIAVVFFLGLIALGSPSSSADNDFGSAPGSDL